MSRSTAALAVLLAPSALRALWRALARRRSAAHAAVAAAVVVAPNMTALRYHGAGQVRLETVPSPRAAPGGVLVEVKAASLCHTELHFADGTLDLGIAPITLGHEAAGVIVAVGAGVDPARVSERVLLYYYDGCGTCPPCARGDEQLCGAMVTQLGFRSDGCLARYVAVRARNALPLPAALTFESAAPIGCGVSTAVHAARMAGGLKRGESVVVYGCNGVGHALVQLAKLRGCRVLAVARQQRHLLKAAELGADVSIDGTDASTVGGAVRAATGGQGADVVFECVGQRATMDACVGWGGALGARGRLVLLGYCAADELRCHPLPLIVQEQTIVGSVGATLADVREALKLVASGQIATVVDSTIALADVQARGLDRMAACACVGKVVVDRLDACAVCRDP
jgi:propanol-preferring alcohol dehydrogenase